MKKRRGGKKGKKSFNGVRTRSRGDTHKKERKKGGRFNSDTGNTGIYVLCEDEKKGDGTRDKMATLST